MRLPASNLGTDTSRAAHEVVAMTTTENRPQANVDEKQARKVAEAAREADWRKPSFGKELFLGRLRMDLIEPWPTVDPEKAADGEAISGRAG